MITATSQVYGRLLAHALVSPPKNRSSVQRAEFLKSLLAKVGPFDEAHHPRDDAGKFSPKPESGMMGRIATRRREDSWGYFGPGTGRNPHLDSDVGAAIRALGIKETEAEEFLSSRMGRHLADAVHHLKPGQNKEEVTRQVQRHLRWYRESAARDGANGKTKLGLGTLQKALCLARSPGLMLGERR